MPAWYDDWQAGMITVTEALRAATSDLAEIESQLAPLETEREAIRSLVTELLTELGGRAEVPGFGRLLITAPGITARYDTKRLDQLLAHLLVSHPEIAAEMRACRNETQRAGTLRIERVRPRAAES